MIVSCTNCKSQYYVNDIKIKDKIFGFNCPKCKTNVEIDNRENKKQKEKERIEQAAAIIDKKSTSGKVAVGKGPEIGDSFFDEEGLIGDDGLIGDIMGSSGVSEEEFEKETPAAVNVKKKGSPDKEPESELPSDDDLSGALQNLSSGMEDEESSLNIDDMDLPDLGSLGDISDAGETADDAINTMAPNGVRKKETNNEFKDNFLDEFADIEDEDIPGGGEGKHLGDDFNPLEFEDDIPAMEEPKGKGGPEKDFIIEEPGDSDNSIFMEDVKSNEIFPQKKAAEEEEEDITIDLDSLDIQLEEEFEKKEGESRETEELSDSIEPLNIESLDIADFEGDIEDIEQKKDKPAQPEVPSKKITHDDEDITLDLDSLDLSLDEVEELKEGEAVDIDDERITLSDAGLTSEELVREGKAAKVTHAEDEDIKLTIDEVAPEVGELPAKKVDELDLIDEELPEIDFDKFEDDDLFTKGAEDKKLNDIHLSRDFKKHESELASPDGDIRDTVPGGMINFSIDYSLKFSRIGAIFRLLCLYPVILIPHFLIFILYSVLSSILSFFNWIIIVFSGMHEEDFTWIQENTIRYLLSLSACSTDLVQEMPKFAGRKDIDYSLQYDVTYPISYSRIMAVLRISIIGIIIAALPHLIILTVLSIGCAIIYLIGIVAIIIRKKWPKVLFDFMVRYYRYYANILSFITGVIDRYPSFKFE